jgi:O-antigen/teichoic acid export membrane protein
MILARLLAPSEFGLMAIVLACSQLFEALTDVGVAPAVIQNKEGDKDAFLNVAWWFSAMRGLCLCLIGFVVSPWIGLFYGEPSLSSLLRVAFLTMLFAGLTSTRLYVLQKNLMFGRYVWVTQGSGLAATVLTLVIALFVPNVWALVFGYVAEAVIRCIASFALCPFVPTWHFDVDCLKGLLGFSRGMFGLPILTFLVLQADVFVLGRVCSKEILGAYSLAAALSSIPLAIFSSAAQPMILPVLCGFQEDLPRLRTTFLGITRTIFSFGFPMATCMAIFGRPVLAIAYGARYTMMGVPFGVLGFYFLVYMAGTVIASAYMSLGRPGLHRRFTVIRAALMAIVIYPAAKFFGPAGAAGALLFCLVVASIFQVLNLRRVVDLSLRRYLSTVADGMVAAILVGALAIPARYFLAHSEVLQLLAAFVLCSMAWSVFAWRRWTDLPGGLARTSELSAVLTR